MPRLRRARNKAVIASGRLVDVGGKNGQRYQTKAENWQELAWQFYDTIPEYHYAVSWMAAVTSRAVLQIQSDADGSAITTGPAVDALDDLFGGTDYHGEMLRQLAVHLTVAGDCYVVAVERPGRPAKWSIRTPSDISSDGVNWRIGQSELVPKSQAVVIRIWKPHPRKPSMADSPSRAVLPILSEIAGLTKHVFAQIDSRLAGAGILFIPDDIDFATQQVQVGSGDEDSVTQSADGLQGFADELAATADTAIKDQASAAALTPIIAQVNSESIKNIKYVTFWTPLEQAAQTLRQEAIGRLAIGMDMPPEVLLGTGDLSHWNAWSVEEAAIKAHVEPFLQVITSSLTEGYLDPLLVNEAPELLDEQMIGADTSELRLRPNRSQEAMELNDRGILSDAAVVRENGFDEGDMMSEAEQALFLQRKLILQGSPTPEMMVKALQALGVDMPDSAAVTEAVTEDQQPGGVSRQTPSLDDHPHQGPPDTQDSVAAAAAMMVYRALERAGNKLRNSRAVSRETAGIDPAQVYLKVDYAPEVVPALLDGAWDRLPELELNVPSQKLAAWMQRYTQRLLTEKLAFTPQSVGEYIRSEMALAGLDVAS